MKMNNKGFAITTIIYGLSIMGILLVAVLMATMASNRSNNKQLAKSIEDELNRFSKTETAFSPKVMSGGLIPDAQQYIVPEGQSGWYQIELWGAQGGGANGGRGAYTSGIIELTEGEVLYFYVGKHSGSTASGKETDVRIKNGNYTDVNSYNTRIMVAAGGGANAGASGGTLYGYNNSMNPVGGSVEASSNTSNFNLVATGGTNPTNGTLVGYPSSYACSTITQPTTANTSVTAYAPSGSNNGGDGYKASNNADIGGVSYIAGYAGSRTYNMKLQSTIDQPYYPLYESVYNEETDTTNYSDNPKKIYYFVDGMMFAGVKQGDGYAKIRRVALKNSDTSKLTRKNINLNGVRYIRDCVTSATKATKISAIVTGEDKAAGKALSAPSANCKAVDLGEPFDLDEIAVWHGESGGADPKDHTIEVSADNTTWKMIKNKNTSSYSVSESVTGIRISAYQPDSNEQLPSTGNYYIIPVTSENKLVSAKKDGTEDANPIGIEYIDGEKRQRWNIELITNTAISTTYNEADPNTYEYKITDLARYKALTIYEEENIINNQLAAPTEFNKNARDDSQVWKIKPIGDGTYIITSAIPSFSSDNPSGNITAQTNQKIGDHKDGVVIGADNKDTTRIRLISLDYSSS